MPEEFRRGELHVLSLREEGWDSQDAGVGGADHRRARPDHLQPGSTPAFGPSPPAFCPVWGPSAPATGNRQSGADHAGLPHRQWAGREAGLRDGLDSGARRHRPVNQPANPYPGQIPVFQWARR